MAARTVAEYARVARADLLGARWIAHVDHGQPETTGNKGRLADDGDRRGDGAPVLVAHTTAAVARRYDADPDGAVAPALAAVADLLGFDAAPDWTHAHRWRFAAPGQDRDEPFHLGDDGIALAGDGWGRARVETAWRSGTLLGRALVERLAAG